MKIPIGHDPNYRAHSKVSYYRLDRIEVIKKRFLFFSWEVTEIIPGPWQVRSPTKSALFYEKMMRKTPKILTEPFFLGGDDAKEI